MEQRSDELGRIKQRVEAREETRQWIQRKKQERYEAQLMALEAKKQDEERRKQHKAEFEATMKQLKMKATNAHKASTQRPPSLLSKMQRGPNTTAAKTTVTKVVHSSEHISPRPRPLKAVAGHPNARRSSSEPLRSPGGSARVPCSDQRSSKCPKADARGGPLRESSLSKEDSPRSSIMSASQPQLMDSKASSEEWPLKPNVTKSSQPKPTSPSSHRREKGGLFASRSERQRILESCKSSVVKPVIAPPLKAEAPPEARPRPPLSLQDLQGGPDEKEAAKRKTDQAYDTDCKKARQEARSVLVSSSSSHPHAKYYHFTYVGASPPPSPLNVSLCSEFHETSAGSRALAQFNTKVRLLKRALSTEFAPDTFAGTLQKSLSRDAVSNLNHPPDGASKSQSSTKDAKTSSLQNKSTCNPQAQISRQSANPKELHPKKQPSSFQSTNSKELHPKRQPSPSSSCDLPSRTEPNPTREDSDASSSFEMGFRDPTPFNFTSTAKARLNLLSGETQRQQQTGDATARQDVSKKSRGDVKEDISDLIAKYVANCQRNVAQLRAYSEPSKVTMSKPVAVSADASNKLSRVEERQDEHISSKPEDNSQFNTFTVTRSSGPPSAVPVNLTFDRSVKPLPLSVEDLRLQFPRSGHQSTSSSCVDFSEVRLLQTQCVLSTSQLPERDSDGTSLDDDRFNRTLVDTDFSRRNTNVQSAQSRETELVNRAADERTSQTYKASKLDHRTFKVPRNVPSVCHPHVATDDFRPHAKFAQIAVENPEVQESRKRSAFYSVPPSLTRPDDVLCPGRAGEVSFRRISSTPISSLQSVETLKDSDAFSDIPPTGPQSCGMRQSKNHEPLSLTTTVPASVPKPPPGCTKSVATQSSLPSAALCDPLLSCSSDALCDPLTELSLTSEAHKDKSMFTVKNWNSPKFSLELLDKMIKAEQERQRQGKIILKLQSKAVTDKVLAELSRLETEKKTLRQSGSDPQSSEQLRNLKKRQRGLLVRLNQERGRLNTAAKLLLSQSQERVQQLTGQYNQLRTRLDTRAVLKVIEDSFRFQDDLADSDVTSGEAMPLDVELPTSVEKLKAFNSMPEGLDRGGMTSSKALPHGKPLKTACQQKILKDQSTSPLDFTPHEAAEPAPVTIAPAAIPMRPALYPKYLRRLSSGSEDSFIYSHNETISDQSDLELRIRSLQAQLSQRKQEAERLKRELRSVRAENLKAKETSLLQQIRLYDKHIQLSARELENEKENLRRPGQPMLKPMILKPTKKMTPNKTAPKMSHRSSLDETSDHSSHDYLKETFESDVKESESDVKSKESLLNQSLREISEMETRVVVAEENVETKKRNLLNKETELKDKNKLKKEVTKTVDLSVHSDETVDGKLSEVLDTFDNEAKKEEAVKDPTEAISSAHDDIVEQLTRLSHRTSESGSEILTELESNRGDIVEETLSTEQSKVDSLVSERIGEALPTGQSHVESVVSENIEEIISTEESKVDSFISEHIEELLSTDENKVDSLRNEIGEEILSTEQSKVESEVSESIEDVHSTERSKNASGLSKTLEALSTEESEVENLKNEKHPSSDIVVVERTESSEGTLVDKRTDTIEETHDSVDNSGSDIYEEKNAESEVMQVSFREKTVNETFIVHEESLSFRGENSVPSKKDEDNELIEEVIEELSEVSTEKEDSPSPVLKELILTPPEKTDPFEQVTKQVDSRDISGKPVESLEADEENEAVENPQWDAKDVTSTDEPKESKPAQWNHSQDVASDGPHQSKPADTSLNASDILSPNISDLQDYLDKDFMGSYSLIHLSPSKAPETPFLHALNRDYQMSRKLQLEQISNEMFHEELNASIESIVGVYNSGRENGRVNEDLNVSTESVVGLHNSGLGDGRDNEELHCSESVEGLDKSGHRGDSVGGEIKDVENDGADDSLSEKIDFLTMNVQHQKELSWTDEDDYLLEVAPPSVVAEVLLQKERQIDQEIEKIKQLTSHIPDPGTRRKLYPYLREIPDKPPPPYIEPASSVPSSEAEVKSIVEAVVQSLTDKDKEAPSSNIARIQMYYSFLQDLTRDVYTAVTSPDDRDADASLPWLQPRVKSKLSSRKVPTDPKEITGRVVAEVTELLALRPGSRPDSFLLRWSRPRRDAVDEIIVQEARAEEPMWTEYGAEKLELKNEITDLILDELLADTVRVFRRLMAGRSQA